MVTKVIKEMKKEFDSSPHWIEHTLNVLNYAQQIIIGEQIKQPLSEIIELSSILHDIGAIQAMNIHGNSQGKYQEIEGPTVAKRILNDVGFDIGITNRVCFIVGHHHTITAIDGIDFQVLWEADALVNMEELKFLDNKPKVKEFIKKNFKTATGENLAKIKFLEQ